MAKKKSEKIIKLNTSFGELVAMSVQDNPAPMPKAKKAAKKK